MAKKKLNKRNRRLSNSLVAYNNCDKACDWRSGILETTSGTTVFILVNR